MTMWPNSQGGFRTRKPRPPKPIRRRRTIRLARRIRRAKHGWLYEGSGQPDRAPQLRDWFAFGGHPMDERIRRDQERAKLEGAYYALKAALVTEAHSADADVSLLTIAGDLRAAKTALDKFNAKGPTP